MAILPLDNRRKSMKFSQVFSTGGVFSFLVVVLLTMVIVYLLSKTDKQSQKIKSERLSTIDFNKVTLVQTTHEVTITITKKFGNAVGVVDARDGSPLIGERIGRTIIWPLAYAARLDKFEMQRFQIMAEALKARIIVVEMPGVGILGKAHMSFMQKLGLIFGSSFNGPARSMIEAIKEVVQFKPGEHIEFAGYSQGVSIAASMIDIISQKNNKLGLNVQIARFIMVEPVNDQQRSDRDIWGVFSLLDTLRSIGREDQYTNRYLDQNNQYGWLVKATDRTPEGKTQVDLLNKTQMTTVIISGMGLRKPFMPKLLKAIERDKKYNTSGISSARIDILRFDKSGMAPINSSRKTVLQLQDAMSFGCTTLTTLSSSDGQGLHHPAFHSAVVMHAVAKLYMKK